MVMSEKTAPPLSENQMVQLPQKVKKIKCREHSSTSTLPRTVTEF